MKKQLITCIVLLCLCINTFAQNETNNLKKYQEVITSKAITKKGYITTHFLDNKLFIEIPEALLNKDLLFVEHGKRYNNFKQVKWEKKENSIQLIIPEIKSEVGNIIPYSDKTYEIDLIVVDFPIETKSISGNYVIEVTELFLNTPKELPGGGKTIFKSLATINKVLVIENTLEVKTTKTLTTTDGTIETKADFTLMLLPEPMMPRLFDDRMGFGKEKDFLSSSMDSRAAIMRWRLEKKHPNKAISEPVKPITLYFDPATPDKWKPYIRAGALQWLPAFESAGFKNAIEVKEPPVNDENFSVSSMRYSFIRWLDKTHYRGKEDYGAGTADKVVDERTGEILRGDAVISGHYVYHSDRYFVRCAHLDKRAQQYPFPDDLIGELIESLTAHEIGHVFGLKDGNYGEYAYPFEKMRDQEWLEKMGHTPSMMNYARENHLIQPEDNIPLKLLHQKVGPTDLYSIRWGYTPFTNAITPDEEQPYLEKIVREQDTNPMYIYRLATSPQGPQSINDIVESTNPMKAAALGIQNLKKVIKLIPKATKNTKGYELKARLYIIVLKHWEEQIEYVTSLVGMYTYQNKYGDQEGSWYTPIPSNKQKDAVAFLNEHVFSPQLWLVEDELMSKIQQSSYSTSNDKIKIISEKQISFLNKIINQKLTYAQENTLEETTASAINVYTLPIFLEEVKNGLWKELEEPNVSIGIYRQQLQLQYIIRLKNGINSKKMGVYTYNNYVRGVMVNSLRELKATIKKGLRKTKDDFTKEHLQLCLNELEKSKSVQAIESTIEKMEY